MLWGHSWLIDKIRNISWHVILQVCPRYKIVVVVGHNGVKCSRNLPTNIVLLWQGSFLDNILFFAVQIRKCRQN